jgi:hypothetical protein
MTSTKDDTNLETLVSAYQTLIYASFITRGLLAATLKEVIGARSVETLLELIFEPEENYMAHGEGSLKLFGGMFYTTMRD